LICAVAHDYNSWRDRARILLHRNVSPDEVLWSSAPLLFEAEPADTLTQPIPLPRLFVITAETVARHRDPMRWHLLYGLPGGFLMKITI